MSQPTYQSCSVHASIALLRLNFPNAELSAGIEVEGCLPIEALHIPFFLDDTKARKNAEAMLEPGFGEPTAADNATL
jgi:hypothetical protein